MRLERVHDLEIGEVRRRVDKLADDIGVRLKLKTSWSGDDLMVSGSGVNGRISVSEQNVVVDITLGFALLMFEGSIRSALIAAMDEHL